MLMVTSEQSRSVSWPLVTEMGEQLSTLARQTDPQLLSTTQCCEGLHPLWSVPPSTWTRRVNKELNTFIIILIYNHIDHILNYESFQCCTFQGFLRSNFNLVTMFLPRAIAGGLTDRKTCWRVRTDSDEKFLVHCRYHNYNNVLAGSSCSSDWDDDALIMR